MKGWYPAWSPDGTQVACSIDERLTIVNVQTKNQKRLLPKNLLFWQQESSWSAVGDKLVFSWNNNPIPPWRRIYVCGTIGRPNKQFTL